MPDSVFRFYGILNDFLPAARRGVAFAHAVVGRVSVKDVVESLGVPHPEIDLLLANGEPIGFSYHVAPGDRISVYPAFRRVDVGAVSLVRPPPLDERRFVLDTHLGRLAAYLRLAGFDTVYGHGWDDERLAEMSHHERRILLTRDAGLLKRSIVDYGLWVRHTEPRLQFREISTRLDLADRLRPFSRCLRCNTPIEPVAKSEVLDRLPPRTRAHYDRFWRCPGCGRVYWEGGHFRRMGEMLRQSVASSE